MKLNFATYYFIHGTPKTASIGHAASHGCVRAPNEDALALAALVVRHAAPESVSHAAGWAAGSRTRHFLLPRRVPLEIRYALAEVDGDTLRLYPDIYRRATGTRRVTLALRALAEAGVDTAQIDRARLRALSAASHRATAAAIASLREP